MAKSIQFSCDQFIWGKMIRAGKDVSGYTLVGKSTGISDGISHQIIAKCTGGISYSILQGEKGYAFLYLSPFAVFSCTERSSIPEGGGRYFVQTRYLIMHWEVIEQIGADFRFLASLSEKINIYEKLTELPQMSKKYKPRLERRKAFMRRFLANYDDEMLTNVLLAVNSHLPIAIFDNSIGNDGFLEFFRGLMLLLPPELQQNLTFATLVSSGNAGPYKVKVNPTGALILPHIIVRPQDSVVRPASLVKLLPRDDGWIQARMAEFLED
jgi:hypothetical protein